MTVDGGESFEDAVPELVLPAFRVALRILGDVAEAEDVAAEALARCSVREGTAGRTRFSRPSVGTS